jgi:hypothetical protein
MIMKPNIANSLLNYGITISLISLAFLSLGCGSSSEPLPSRVLEASCGMCQFSQTEQKGCFINVKLEKKSFPVVGAPKLTMEEMHQPGGYCVTVRKVRVSGKVEHDRFMAFSWELLPMKESTPALPAGH